MTKQYAVRQHEIACGHRVVGHEGKCRHLHGHGYVFHFYCEASQLDALGRVIDFSVIKSKLCMWLEEHWDHRMLLWERDPLAHAFHELSGSIHDPEELFGQSVELVPCNPTAENLSEYLLNVIGPAQLAGTGVTLMKVIVEETRKCWAVSEL